MAIKDNIVQAMGWKYPGAKIAKTPNGDDISVWSHPSVPQPSKAQIAIDVAEYEQFLIDEKVKSNAFNTKKIKDITALGSRASMQAEVASANSIPELRALVSKLAEIVYSNEKSTID